MTVRPAGTFAAIAGIEPGRRIRLCGTVGIDTDGRRSMVNPRYELLSTEPDS